MAQFTLELPLDLKQFLDGIAAEQHKSVEEVAVERLRILVAPPGSPRSVVLAMRELPPLDPAWVDEMEEEIRKSRLPVRDTEVFD